MLCVWGHTVRICVLTTDMRATMRVMHGNRFMLRFGLSLIVLCVGACTVVPGTGRQRLDLVPSDQMSRLGQRSFQQLLEERTVISSGDLVDRVQCIGQRVIASARELYPSAELPEDWQIVVLKDDSPNAFAVPGGGIGVHTGMARVAETDDAIAFVMGHEVAHVLAEHAGERLSQAVLISGGLLVGSAAAREEDESTQAAILLALGIGSQVGVALPYSRLHEAEADELGLLIAANAGYDPRASIGLWERMEAEGDSRLEFLSTHPNPGSRVVHLQSVMPEARRLYLRAKARERSVQVEQAR